jgi:Rrf2 family transcriptional regulator, nitric oxide-sensitive transcriptional repressor
MEPVQRIKACPLKIKSHRQQLCHRHRQLDAATEEIETASGQATSDEITAAPSSAPLVGEG